MWLNRAVIQGQDIELLQIDAYNGGYQTCFYNRKARFNNALPYNVNPELHITSINKFINVCKVYIYDCKILCKIIERIFYTKNQTNLNNSFAGLNITN